MLRALLLNESWRVSKTKFGTLLVSIGALVLESGLDLSDGMVFGLKMLVAVGTILAGTGIRDALRND